MNENYTIDLVSALDQKRSQKQLNSDIKQIEKTLNLLQLTGTFSKTTQKELNAYIKQLSAQLSTIKLKAEIDSKNIKADINKALNNVSFKDIDALNIDENKTGIKVQKIISDAKSFAEKNPISIGINFENRRNKLDNDLTAYMNRNSKINESSVLLKESNKVRELISAINDKKSLSEATDSFRLFKSEVASTGYNSKSTSDKIKSMLGHVTKISSVFGVASLAVNNFTKSISELKEIDTLLTEISKANDKLSKSDLNKIGNDSFGIASQYGKKANNYLSGVQEASRAGYENAEAIAQLSVAAQGAGDMTDKLANKYLIATDKAYKFGGSVEKLTEVLDGSNYITNHNAVNMAELAESMSIVGSTAASFGVDVDETTAALGTMIATTQQSGSEVARAFKAILLNIRQVSDEEEGIDAEGLTKYEKACNALNVKLKETKNGVLSLRDPMEVLKELAVEYNKLEESDVRRTDLLSSIGGKLRATQLDTLLRQWDTYETMLKQYADGTGSMAVEAEKTAKSWEGRLNSLSNSFTSFVNTVTSKDAVLGGISFFDKLIQGAESFVNTFGTIPVVLTTISTAMTALNKDFGITQIINPETKKFDIEGNLGIVDFSAIKNQKKHFEEAGEAIAIWNNKLRSGKADLEVFDNAVVQNNAQLKDYLSTASKDAPASLSEYKEYLNASGVSTEALRLKTILLNSAISMGLGIAIQAAVQGITYLIQREENLRQAAEEAANAYKESSSSIDDYVTKYTELREALIKAKGNEEETYNIKKQLLDLQTELNDKFGDEYGQLNLVTDAYKDQTDALKAYNQEVAKTYLNENQKGIKNATKEMTAERQYNLGSASNLDSNDKWMSLREVALQYKDKGIDLASDQNGSLSIQLTTDAESAYEVINEFESDLREKAKELGDEHLFDSVLDISSSELNRAKETIDKYGEIYKQALMANMVSDNGKSETYNKALDAVEKYNEAVLKSEDPFTDEKVKNARQALKDIQDEISSDDSWEKYGAIVEEVFEQVDTKLIDFNEKLQSDSGLHKLANDLKDLDNLDLKSLNPNENASFDKLKESADEYGLSVDELIDSLVRLGYVQGEIQSSTLNIENPIFSAFENTDFGIRIQHITDLFNEGTISHKEYFDALQSEIDNFDVSNFTDSIEDMDKASAQFFVDSMQQTADGLSTLINSFDKGEMSISEYLEGYLAIGNTLSKLTDDLQENSAAWNENGEAISEVGNTALDDTQNKLNSAMSVIESYQDSIYSLEQIMNDAVTVGSDEFTAHANVIAEDLYRIIQTGGEMADTIANTLGTTTSEIAQSLTENVSNQEIACQAIMANTNNAITDMASSIGELFDTLGDAISNFKVDLSFGVKSIDWKKVNVLGAELNLPEIKFELGASGESLDKIGSALSSFGKTIASNYTPQTIDLEDFHFGSTDAAKDRNYSPSSGITKNYDDALNKIKDSAKEASKSASKAAKDSTDDIKNEFEEMVDFFDRRKDVLNDALSLLKTNLDNVTGSFAKNKLIDAELGVTEEKFKNYSDALNMYTQNANEALSKLPSDIAAKIKDGAVDLTTFIGDGNKEVVEAIKDYENWADSVAECRQQLAELRTAIRQLELQKFNNIMEEFSNQFDLREDGKDLISKQIDLLKEAGQLIGESFFTTQIDQSKKQLELLEAEKAKLVEQMTSAISSGRVQKGSDEWLSMVNSLTGVESEILDCKKAIEEFDNELLQLHWDIFDRIQNQFSDLNSEISNIIDLFDDFEVSDDKGVWSKEAIAQLGLLSQQYELAQYRVQQYNDEINELNAQYLAGKYSATEYADKLADLYSEQWNCVKSADSALSSIMDLNEARVNNAIKGIEKEVSAYKDLIDAQIDALEAEKALHDYKKSIEEKSKNLADIDRQIAAVQNDTSAAGVARLKLLQDQRQKAQDELDEYEYDHRIEMEIDALNKQYEAYEKERNDEITALRESLNDEENIIAASFETVKANTDLVGQEIATIATQHGITVSDAIITSWQNGENAIASYGDVLSTSTSAFIGNIMGVENEVYNLQAKANETANSLAWMFSTRADNLVNELASSYYSEENLNYMTQALHDSLINTLEGGYNISSIQSALDGIASGLNNVASAANNATSAMAAMGAAQASAAQQTASNNTGKAVGGYSIHQVGAVDPTYTVRNGRGDIVSSGNTLKEAQDYLKRINAYASGTRNAKGNIRIVDEEGKELELPKLQSGRYAIGNEGDQILSKEQTDRINEWSKITPDELLMMLWKDNHDMGIMETKVGRINQPEIISSNVNNNSVNVHYDSVVQINGDVHDANRIVKQIESVTDKAIKKSWHDFEMTRKYGSY